MSRKLFAVSAIALSLLVVGCSSDSDSGNSNAVPEATPGVGNSAYDNIVNNAELSTLRTAIDEAGLAATLDNEASEFTIFAPNNAAFDALDDGVLTTLLADPTGQLADILKYHVVSGTTDAAGATAAVANGPVDLDTLNGAVSLAASDAGLTIGGANIVGADSNYSADTSVGVVHIIDAVLIPPQ